MRTAFRRVTALAVLVFVAMLPLAAPALAAPRVLSEPDQWKRYTDANGFEVLAWYQCSDGIANVAVVFLYQDVKDHDGWGPSRKFCLNADDGGNSYNSFCEDVPGHRWEALPFACGTAFDDSFNDRTSYVRVTYLARTAYVRLCQHADYNTPCMTIDDATDKDFSSGGKPGPSWNDTISSMRLRQ
jgi:hypothetical protein